MGLSVGLILKIGFVLLAVGGLIIFIVGRPAFDHSRQKNWLLLASVILLFIGGLMIAGAIGCYWGGIEEKPIRQLMAPIRKPSR